MGITPTPPPKPKPRPASAPKPKVGARIKVNADHYFYFDGSDTPALRIKQNPDGTWESQDPSLLTGLILFVMERKTTLPLDIVVVRVKSHTVLAAELGWR